MRRVSVLAIVIVLLAVPTATASAATAGTVNVQVSSAGPCVTVTGSFNYGNHIFSTNGSASTSGVVSGPSITNCSGTSESFLAHVSNLTDGISTWTTVSAANPCAIGVDKFDLNTSSIGTGSSSSFDLTGTDQNVGTLTNATPYNWVSVFTMPCVGSSGAGTTMSGTISITATF